MKKVLKILGIIALVAVIGFSMTACEEVEKPTSRMYTGSDSSGNTYEFLVEQGPSRAVYTPQAGDLYTLTVKNSAGRAIAESKGTVSSFRNGNFRLSCESGGQITLSVRSGAISGAITGTIPGVDGNDDFTPPSDVTPPDDPPDNPPDDNGDTNILDTLGLSTGTPTDAALAVGGITLSEFNSIKNESSNFRGWAIEEWENEEWNESGTNLLLVWTGASESDYNNLIMNSLVKEDSFDGEDGELFSFGSISDSHGWGLTYFTSRLYFEDGFYVDAGTMILNLHAY